MSSEEIEEGGSSDVHSLEVDGRQFILVGTAHISRESVDLVRKVIDEERPDCVCVELDASQTAFLMALVSAWHVDKVHGVGEGWRGYRTYDEVGAIYAEITGRREPIEGETVRKYASRISTSLRSPTLCESVVREMARKLNIIRRRRYGYQIGRHGLKITGLDGPTSGLEDTE